MKKAIRDDLNEAIRMRLPLKSIRYLVLNGDCDVNALSPDGYPAWIEAIVAQMDDAALFLIEQGADIHFTDARGASGLYFAVHNGSWDLFQKLTGLGLNAELKVDGWPLLNVACSRAYNFKRFNLEVSRIVNGRSRKVTEQAVIDQVAGKDRYQNFALIINQLLSWGADVNAVESGNKQTPLILCAARGDEKIIELLLQKGANVHEKDAAGLVALHWAARKGFLNIVQALLKSGADPNVAEAYGFTPLHEAAENNHMDIVKLLIKKGADKSKGITGSFAPFSKGDSAKDIAIKKGNTVLAALL